MSLDGIGKRLAIKGEGVVAWTSKADNGMYRTLKVPCYYVSLRKLIQAYPGEQVSMNATSLKLAGNNNNIPSITIDYCPNSELPIGHKVDPNEAALPPTTYKAELKKRQPALTSPSNFNLSEPEKELLRWHHKLGHVAIRRIQWLFRQGILATSDKERHLQAAAAKLTCGPLCTACQYAKQRRKTYPGTVKRAVPQEDGGRKANTLFPGQEIAIDIFYARPRGRLLNTFGKEAADQKYKGGCIFADCATSFLHIGLLSNVSGHSTITVKEEFDKMCQNHGVVPQRFISDNGSEFVNSDFQAHLEQLQQSHRLAGVGAHHSNGVAERGISTIMSIARAMLHHSALHWPDVADVELWPLALLHAVDLLNKIPRPETGRSAYELFTRKTYPYSKLREFHVWGCPVYVLDSHLADNKKLPRWQPGSGRHIYVGNSKTHSHSIPLVLSLDTGKITAQYHVVFDWFHTVDEPPNHQSSPPLTIKSTSNTTTGTKRSVSQNGSTFQMTTMRSHLIKLITITLQLNQRESISRSKHALYVINFMLLLHCPLKVRNALPPNLL